MSKEKNKPILLDCDGVFSNFCQGCLNVANKKLGTNITIDSIKQDTRQYSWWNDANIEDAIMSPGFCESIPVIEGSKEFFKSLRELDHPIMFITSPYNKNKYWHWERQQWLEKHFEIKRTELTFATEKRYMNGLILLDDHVGNILHWQEYQKTDGVLIERPWNEDILKDCSIFEDDKRRLFHTKKIQSVYRTNNWKEIYEFILERV